MWFLSNYVQMALRRMLRNRAPVAMQNGNEHWETIYDGRMQDASKLNIVDDATTEIENSSTQTNCWHRLKPPCFFSRSKPATPGLVLESVVAQ